MKSHVMSVEEYEKLKEQRHLEERIQKFQNGTCPDCYIDNCSTIKGEWQCACRNGSTKQILKNYANK